MNQFTLTLVPFAAVLAFACGTDPATDNQNGETDGPAGRVPGSGGSPITGTGGESVQGLGGDSAAATGGGAGMSNQSEGSGGELSVGTGGGSSHGGGSTGGGGSGGAGSSGGGGSAGAGSGGGSSPTECTEVGAAESFSFFVTSWHHLRELSGSDKGFGGDLRYGKASGLEGADAICQEIAWRVCFGHRTWKAYLSTSKEDAIDRIGAGPWYDFTGQLVANNPLDLVEDDRPGGGACDHGSYDETGVLHDGKSDANSDGKDDDDHDILTGSNKDGRYAGFSCNNWTSVSAINGGGGNAGPMIGHSWPRSLNSGRSFTSDHPAPGCGAGTNFSQNGGGNGTPIVGGGGGYGGIYCFALPK